MSSTSTNRLAGETSPYLLQHAHNPVDWYPWGDEAFQKARDEDRPIFLSVGYSACHWCHVMERESFEDPAIAAVMNRDFVNIKVDREERPDIDQIYMAAVQAMTGQGGWPMSVFLTPDGRPFFGGTYFPPRDAHGRPGFPRVLERVAHAWAENREQIVQAAGTMVEQLQGLGAVPGAGDGGGGAGLDITLLDNAAIALGRAYEPTYGGFGRAPKFPHPMDLRLLLRQYVRTGDIRALHMVRHTLAMMARGGIYDHLGGGFARYSTDDRWLVPHFEKMLYDNALLASTYLDAYRITHDPEDARVARETLDYVLARMTSPEGPFHSTEDADSEGVEGLYYVWTPQQLRDVLGEDRAATFAAVYDVTERGNFEGRNILHLPRTIAEAAADLGRDPAELNAELRDSRQRLLAARDQRVPPGKDTKALVSWNGLMIAALAEAARVLKDPRYLDAAAKAAGFLLDHLRQGDGRLLHSYKDGQARFNGYLDDYACLIDGLTRLFEAGGEPRWIEAAVALAERMIDQFADASDNGGFHYTGRDHETLIVRPRELLDNATPSANAMAATALVRLARLTGRDDLETAARGALEAVSEAMRRFPTAAGQSLIALDILLAFPRELAVIGGDDPAELGAVLEAIAQRPLFTAVVAPHAGPGPADPSLQRLVPLLADRPARDGRATTYVCERFACKAPVTGVAGVEEALG